MNPSSRALTMMPASPNTAFETATRLALVGRNGSATAAGCVVAGFPLCAHVSRGHMVATITPARKYARIDTLSSRKPMTPRAPQPRASPRFDLWEPWIVEFRRPATRNPGAGRLNDTRMVAAGSRSSPPGTTLTLGRPAAHGDALGETRYIQNGRATGA